MLIGSHNTMSYLKPKYFWGWIVKFAGRCQDKTLKEQLELGVRLFDIRIIYDDIDKTYNFAHGIITYSGDVWDYLDELNNYALNNFGEEIWCRVICERNKNTDKFYDFCQIIDHKYKSITFIGGNNKKNWQVIYNFNNEEPKYIDKYASCNHDTKYNTGWIIDDIYPRIYAWLFNEKWRDKLGSDTYFLLQDFVGVY